MEKKKNVLCDKPPFWRDESLLARILLVHIHVRALLTDFRGTPSVWNLVSILGHYRILYTP